MRKLIALLATLALLPASVVAASIPQGAQRVSLLTFTVKAACDTDATLIDSITVKHSGLGNTSDIERVYLGEGIRRLSPAVSFSSSDKTAELRLHGLSIAACTSRTFSILADFAPDAAAGGEHRLTIDHITSDKALDIGSADTSSDVRRTVPSFTGTVSVEYRDLLTTVRYGSNRTVARIFLKANAPFSQDLLSVTLTNDGSAKDADLQRLRLYDGKTLLAPEVASLSGDTVRFVLNPPLQLGQNSSRLLIVKADVRARARKTINLKVDEPSDIEVIRSTRSR